MSATASVHDARVRLILESAGDFAIFATDLDGRVTEWTTGARGVLGWDEAEILGQDARIIWTPEDRQAGIPETEMRHAREEGRATDERWHLRRDGSRFWASGELMPLLDGTGRLIGYTKILRDRTEQHEAGLRLQESEARWRGLFERLQEGLIVGEVIRDAGNRVVDWRYLDVNPAWGELVGIPFRTAAGRTLRELFPDIEEVWVNDVAAAFEVDQLVAFTRQVGALGRWYEGNVHRLGGDRFSIVFHEITQRHLAERRRIAVQELSDRLRDELDPAAMALIGAEVIGRTLVVDRVGYGTLERDGETFVVAEDWTAPGRSTLAGTYRMDDYGLYAADLRRGETVWIGDVRHDPRTAASSKALEAVAARALINVPVIEQGRVVAILYVNCASPRAWTVEELDFAGDIADRLRQAIERRRAEQELHDLAASLEQQVEERTRDLRDAQDFTRLALTSVGGVGAWTYDAASDRFFCSPAIAELYGLDAAQAERGISRPGFLANVHPDDRPALAATMAGGLATAGSLEMEYRICHPGGSLRWVLSRGYTYHEEGRAVRRVGVGVETTERHQLEEQLRQSQKMEAVGQLTGGLAHDFNNLLTGITGSLELLGTRLMQGRIKDLDRYVSAAQGAARRAAALTHRLLAFSRRQTLDPRPTDVNRLVNGMEDLIRRTVGPAVELEVVGAGGLWQALVDPPQLENALLNLCINARDAMPAGGRITVETSNRWLDDRGARERDLKPGQYLTLCVSDTGTGMPPEVIAKAFDPFFTTKPLGQGTGLGLSMIYGFVRQSGGQARIYSEVGQGTTVCLYLPRFLGKAETAEAAPDLEQAPRANNGETVLVVDDEPTVRMLVTEVLEELGYAAIEAADGPSGLKVLQSDVRIDLLVSDVGLPGGMNGRQMADAARAGRPGLKVLFITGYAENAVVGGGHLDPGMQVLNKPFAMEALASRIREMIVTP